MSSVPLSDSQNHARSTHPTTEFAPHKTLHFYQNDHLASELAGPGNRHIFWAIGKALAQFEQANGTKILQVDDANSVIGVLTGANTGLLAYPPYGYLAAGKMLALIGFNGQWQDPASLTYLLGNGHRPFHTSIGRFGIADTQSPFDKGGLNSYAYCAGDPINRDDSTGSVFQWIRKIFNRPRKPSTNNTIIKLAQQTKIAADIGLKVESPPPTYQQTLAQEGWPGVPSPRYTRIPEEGQTTRNINLGVELTPIEAGVARSKLLKLDILKKSFETHVPIGNNPEQKRMRDITRLQNQELIILHRLNLATRQNTGLHP